MSAKRSTPAEQTSELSHKMRAYMAEIYRLIDRQPQHSEYVSTSRLADLLLVSPPAASRMVNRLSELGLLHHRRYQGIAITEPGRVAALKQIRRQRIAECFLTEIMGMSWLTVHEEAQRLSAGLSEAVTDRMFSMTGEPAFCPHGEPIPNAAGQIPPLDDEFLARIEAGANLRVSRLITRELDRLTYIEALGLVPGAEIEVIHVAPFDGPMQLKLGREYRIIGNSLAYLIRARRV